MAAEHKDPDEMETEDELDDFPDEVAATTFFAQLDQKLKEADEIEAATLDDGDELEQELRATDEIEAATFGEKDKQIKEGDELYQEEKAETEMDTNACP